MQLCRIEPTTVWGAPLNTECVRETERATTTVSCNSPLRALQQTGSEVLNYPSALYLSLCLCLSLFFSIFLTPRSFILTNPVFPSWSFFLLSHCLCFISLSARQPLHTHTHTHTNTHMMEDAAVFCSLTRSFLCWFRTHPLISTSLHLNWNLIVLRYSLLV